MQKHSQSQEEAGGSKTLTLSGAGLSGVCLDLIANCLMHMFGRAGLCPSLSVRMGVEMISLQALRRWPG